MTETAATDTVRIDPGDLPRAGRPVLKIMAKWAAVLLAAAWGVFLLAWFALYGVFLPHVGAWKPEIEAWASAALGVRVQIGEIEAPSSGGVPSLVLSEVALLDSQGRTALRLPRVHASLSAQSLLSLQLRFEQLLIEDAALEVRRDAKGLISVAGLSLDEQAISALDGSTQMGDWLFAQGEFAIRRAQVRWIDESRGAPALVLEHVDFVRRNSLRRHEWRLDATPAGGPGQRYSVRGRFRQGLFQARSDWRQWSGEIYADLPQADVDRLRPHVDLPAELLAGAGAARVWLDVDRGRLRGVTADVGLSDVRLRWPGIAEPLVLQRLQGRVLASQDSQSVTLALERVALTTGQGREWPSGDMRLVLHHEPLRDGAAGLRPAATASAGSAPEPQDTVPVAAGLLDNRQIRGGEFSAARLDLELLASMAVLVPLDAGLRLELQGLLPKGQVEDLKAAWDGPIESPKRYRVSARLEELSLAPGSPATGKPAARLVGARPGLRGATIALEATEAGGQADLTIADGAVALPGIFEAPELPLQQGRGRLSWQFKPGQAKPVELRLASMTLRNSDAQGELQGVWRGNWSEAAAGLGQLDLTARIERMRADSVHRYLPQTLPKAARDYVRGAMRGGRLQDVALRVKGELADFPFNPPGSRGEFRVSGLWREGTYAMLPREIVATGAAAVPGWPEAGRVEAKLRIDGRGMDFSEVSGRILGVEITRGGGRLDWNSVALPLKVELQARGPAQDFLRYVQATPVNEWTSRVLAAAQASGPAALSLAFDMPLMGAEPARVKGTVQLNGNELRLNPSLPPLSGVRSRLDFSERGFSIVGGSAQLLGGDVSLDGGLSAGGPVRVNLQGTAQSAAIRNAPEMAWLGPVSGWFSGQIPYRLGLTYVSGQLQWLLTSPLTGTGIDLPAPLGKPAAANWAATPLRIESAAAGERARVDLQYGRMAQARILQHAPSGALLAAAVAVGGAELPAMPRSGLEAAVVVDRLDLDPWRAMLMGQAAGPAARSAQAAEPDSLASLKPLTLRLRAERVMVLGRALEGVSAVATTLGPADAPAAWGVDLQARQLAGRIEWRPGNEARRDLPSRLVARLSRLSIPPSAADAVEDLASDERIEWPAMDILIEEFELRGRKLGRLEVAAEAPRAGRDWQLTRLALSNPQATLSAKGSWAKAGGIAPSRETALDFELELRDSGALLATLGMPQALRGGAGRLNGRVAWRGSPLAPETKSMQGQMRLDLRSGQFLKADPGAARLLGVLSLQSLPRRLVLDFRDVFQEGFPFDAITGDVTVSGGVASTNNLRMRGVQAAVLMEGSADLSRETQDLRVLVVPEINAGTASLAYATINPALGLGTFLAQLFLRRPLMVANTREFSITGSWEDPRVERLQRSTPVSGEDVDRATRSAEPPQAPAPGPAAAPPEAASVPAMAPSTPAPGRQP